MVNSLLAVREVVFIKKVYRKLNRQIKYSIKKFREPTTVCSMSQFLLQMNLGALLTASLAHNLKRL